MMAMPTSAFTEKRFLALGKNYVGKNVFARDSRAVFAGAWSRTSPSLLFSSVPFASLLPHFPAAIPHSFSVCLLFLPQDIFIVATQHVCCTSSR